MFTCQVKLSHQMGTILSIVDTRLGSFPSECLERFVDLALSCCHDKPEERPSMLVVVRELENILDMMPDVSGALYSDLSPRSSSRLPSSPTSTSCITRDQFASGSISGSDLVSGVVPTIRPRWHLVWLFCLNIVCSYVLANPNMFSQCFWYKVGSIEKWSLQTTKRFTWVQASIYVYLYIC